MSRRGRSMRAGLVMASIAVLGGCAVGPNYVRPPVVTPEAYKELDGWKVAEPGGGQVFAAVGFQEALDDGVEAFGRDGAEHVGEEVEADVVQVGDEPLAARPGEVGEERDVRTKQR